MSGLADPGTGADFSMTYPFIVQRRSTATRSSSRTGTTWTSTPISRLGAHLLAGRHIMKKRRKKATLHDIEMANIPFLRSDVRAPWVPELVRQALRYYRILNCFAQAVQVGEPAAVAPARFIRSRRTTTRSACFCLSSEHPRPACFIFGHTHRPGIGQAAGQRRAGGQHRLLDESRKRGDAARGHG